jgi:quercetin dioxygenase-like cupin family protein
MDQPSASRAAAAPTAAPAGKRTLADWMKSRIARYDPKYRRAQMRYVGTGGTGIDADSNAVPAEHFTFSTMVLPPGCEGPLHVHQDVEEVFFMIRGKIRLFLEKDGETWETVLGERDLISVPAGVYRGLVNERDEEALMCVMLGSPKPVTPTYPPDHPLAKIDRSKKK